MNLKHPYEKHLAEKLVQHPPPGDPDQNWQQMKTLLDKNIPRGGGGPSSAYRWWLAGTVVAAVMVGIWFGGKQLLTKEQRNEAVAGTIKTVNNKTAESVASTEKIVEQPAANAPTSNTTDEGAAVNNGPSTDIPAANTTGKSEPVANTEAAKARSSGNNPVEATASNSTIHNKITPDRKNIYATATKNQNKEYASDRSTNNRHHRPNASKGNAPVTVEEAAVTNGAENKGNNKKDKSRGKKSSAGENGNQLATAGAEGNPDMYTPAISTSRSSLPSQPSNGYELKASLVTYKVNYTNGTIISPSGVVAREFTYYPFPDVAVNKRSTTHKKPRAFQSSEDKTFAIGLSLPLGFPIGDQQPLAYNSRAGVNTISDYIPSPHFQYHFNNKTYVQAGLQFKAPQFISPFLLYQNEIVYQQGPNLLEQITNITARKLYYFNLPLTVYHSPLKNFYMGAGLQYSSLLSGVAYYEQVVKKHSPIGPPQEYLTRSYFTRFKHDSLSNRLNNNELRLLVDMSYYWSRFTVGLQYSQGFNNYVSFQVTPVSPYYFDKNKSLQFYLRYNIWEDKKRKQSKGQSLLTLK
jgi:hypothetical protein